MGMKMGNKQRRARLLAQQKQADQSRGSSHCTVTLYLCTNHKYATQRFDPGRVQPTVSRASPLLRTGLPARTLAQDGVGKKRQRETWQAGVTSMTRPQDVDDVDLVSRVVSRGRLSRPSARMLPQ